MDGQKKQITTSTLPQHIVDEEILPRLAAKSLLKFRCVSKSWRSLIDSKRFIKTHHRYSKKNPSFPHQSVILETRYSWPKHCPLQLLLKRGYFQPFPGENPMETPNREFRGFEIVGCCNGLVCIVNEPETLFIWNPSTRKVKNLPKDSGSYYCGYGGFGWVESSDEYKVFAKFYDDADFDYGKLYSSKTKSWKTLGAMDRYSVQNGVFLDEKLHYLTLEGNVNFLDLKSEKFGTIEMPKYRSKNVNTLLGVLRDCLCMLLYNSDRELLEVMDVWIMKEYGVKDCWTRVVARDHVLELLRQPRSAPSIVGSNGKILVFFAFAILVYHPQENVFRALKKYQFYNSRHLYIESLESPEDL